MLCNHHLYIVPEHFITPKRNPHPHEQSLPKPLAQPLTANH